MLEIIAFILIASTSPYHQSQVSSVFQEINGKVSAKISSVKSYFNLRQINDSLMAENARLREIVYTSKENPFNDSLIFDTTGKIHFRLRQAHVVNNTLTSKNNFIIIDKGKNDGIHKQMGLMTDKGIVGIVTHVSANYTLALSILSREFRVNAKILELGELGSLTWDGKSPDYMLLTDIPNQVKIMKNQHVVVGPYSRFFPENIPIGTVEDFRPSSNSSLLEIKVKLYNNIRSLQKVYLIENMNGNELQQLEQMMKNEK